MIVAENLTKRFGDTEVFSGLSFRIEDGEHVLLSGPSGKGKTTLLRVLCGLERPDGGRVTGVRPEQIAYQFQEPRLFETLTALQNVTCVLPDPKQTDNARELLRRLGLEEAEEKYPRELSGGMKQRVALARALIVDRPVVFLDEPFTALDGELKARVGDLLRERLEGKTLLLVSHDPVDGILTRRTLSL